MGVLHKIINTKHKTGERSIRFKGKPSTKHWIALNFKNNLQPNSNLNQQTTFIQNHQKPKNHKSKTWTEPTTVRHVAVRPSGQISFHQRLTTGLSLLLVFQSEEWMQMMMEMENYDCCDPVGRTGLFLSAGKVSFGCINFVTFNALGLWVVDLYIVMIIIMLIWLWWELWGREGFVWINLIEENCRFARKILFIWTNSEHVNFSLVLRIVKFFRTFAFHQMCKVNYRVENFLWIIEMICFSLCF